jgi:hypothetical protein
MDNIFAICTYNKMGSKDPEINKEMECFWEWCRRRRIIIVASYIPGVLVVADEPSRRRAGLWEFNLAKGVFQQLSDWAISSPMTPLTQAPVFDLCATHINAQTPLFASLYPDPFCTIVDCLKHPLRHLQGPLWAFPPPKILTQLLAKVREEGVTVLLLCVA